MSNPIEPTIEEVDVEEPVNPFPVLKKLIADARFNNPEIAGIVAKFLNQMDADATYAGVTWSDDIEIYVEEALNILSDDISELQTEIEDSLVEDEPDELEEEEEEEELGIAEEEEDDDDELEVGEENGEDEELIEYNEEDLGDDDDEQPEQPTA